MLLTVIICTRDRADQLRQVLESVVKQSISKSIDWEILIVDNGSTDQTPNVINDFVNRLPIRQVYEPKAGLSNARNCGVREAKGEYICWTDDDVELDSGWLQAYADAFVEWPHAVFFGGPVIPRLEGDTPDWFVENRPLFQRLLAERDLGFEQLELDDSPELVPYGANFAVRTKEQKLFEYDPELGVGPQQRRLGEETSVISAIVSHGGHGRWVPQARLNHIIPQSRQTIKYVRQYERSSGETWAYKLLSGGNSDDTKSAATTRMKWSPPLWVKRKKLIAEIKHFLNSESLENLMRVEFWRGAQDYFLKRKY